MIVTCLNLMMICVQAGHVVSVSQATPIRPASRASWVLQDETITIRHPTRGIVTRVAPDGMTGVVEIKLFDGTNRLGWLEIAGVIGQTGGGDRRTDAKPTGSPASASSAGQRSRTRTLRKHRLMQRQRLAAIDAALGRMLQAALQAEAATPDGPILINPEVFAMPLVDVSQLVVNPMPVINLADLIVPVF